MTPQQLWQAQSAGAPPVTLEYVRYRAANLTKEASAKHWRVFVICGLLTVQLIWNLFHRYAEMPIMQMSMIYLYAVTWINLVHWFGRTKVAPMPPDAGVTGSLRFYRRELERQRDAAKGNFVRIVLLPLPGLIGLFASLILEREPVRWAVIWSMGIFVVLLGSYVSFSNRLHRLRFQKEIDAVNLLVGHS
jgi:hypothetical protein